MSWTGGARTLVPTWFRLSRPLLLALGAAFCLTVFGWLLLGPSDAEKIEARLAQLALAVGSKPQENLAFRALRLKRDLREGLESDVRFTAPELQSARGLQELTQLAAGAPRLFGEFDVSIDDTEIAIDAPNHQATVLSEVTLTGLSEELRRDARRVRFTLREKDGEWRVSTIDVEAQASE
jgi:hypothetical protein